MLSWYTESAEWEQPGEVDRRWKRGAKEGVYMGERFGKYGMYLGVSGERVD